MRLPKSDVPTSDLPNLPSFNIKVKHREILIMRTLELNMHLIMVVSR